MSRVKLSGKNLIGRTACLMRNTQVQTFIPLLWKLTTALFSVEIPASILKSQVVRREVEFFSPLELNNFHVLQQIALHGRVIEGVDPI